MSFTRTPSTLISNKEFIILLALTQALQALAIDSILPALGAIDDSLQITNPNHRQFVVGIFLLFSGLGSLLPGPLADKWGRKPVLLTCLGGYMLTMLLAALAWDFNILILARALGGLCASGLTVLPLAIIRDRFEGDQMARLQSLIAVIFMVVPMMAPTLGQAVLLFAGWRWIFALMGLMALIMSGWVFWRLPETLNPEFRQPTTPRIIARNLKLAFTTRSVFGYVLGAALVQGALFGFINSSQQLIAEHFQAGTAFPLVFGAMALFMASTNFTNSRIVERFGARRVSHTAMLAYVILSLLQWWIARGTPDIWQFVPVMTLNICLMGFIGGNFSAISLLPFARIAGSAAAVQIFIRVIIASAMGIVIGLAFDDSALPLATGFVIAGLGAFALVLFSERGQLFQRTAFVRTDDESI